MSSCEKSQWCPHIYTNNAVTNFSFLNEATFFSDWLLFKRKDPNFEHLEDNLLAQLLRTFFAEVRKRNGKPYSKSGMINLRAGLNRYLQSPPYSRIVNLMHNDAFQNANSVFIGVLRHNKQQGFDTSRRRTAITRSDLDKLYNEYFIPGLAAMNTEVLQHKVFFDMVYYLGRRGKEGLRELQKDWFESKFTEDGIEYIQIKVNEVTKKNQGDRTSTRMNDVHNDNNIMLAMPTSDRCPVNSFHHYMKLLNPKINDFFQRPNIRKKKYDASPIGLHTLGDMMAEISKLAQLSTRYTNHQIRKTTGTAMGKSGQSAPKIAHHLKQKNIQSVMHYIEGPTLEDKQENAQLLHNYTHKDAPLPVQKENVQPPPLLPTNAPPPPQAALAIAPTAVQPAGNIQPKDAIIPFEPNFNENPNDNNNPLPLLSTQNNNQVVNNQMRQAPIMFQGATFHNCTIQMNVPQ